MSPEVVVHTRRVWMLMFDQLRSEHADQKNTKPLADSESAATSQSVFGPFDSLEMQSSIFEQYMLQDTRDASTVTDILGGIAAVRRFTARIHAANKSVCLVRMVCLNGDSSEIPLTQPQENFLSDLETTARLIERTIPQSSTESGHFDECWFRDDSELHSALDADLVWFDVKIRAAENSLLPADRVLQLIQRFRLEMSSSPSEIPVLIVSPMHGFARDVATPFSSGLSESQTHVPLWIEYGAGHACRIQALTGSFDLLPTLVEYLTGTKSSPEGADAAGRQLPHGSVQLNGNPMSLVNVCELHNPLPDRLLCLTGDSWNALRTQQYLLVHSRSQESTSAATESMRDEEWRTTRRLYLKPEDVWNVNDAIVAYAQIADQMEAAAAESARSTS